MQYRSKMNRLNKNLGRIELKRTGLLQNLAESKQSEHNWPLYKQERRENEVPSSAGSKRKQTMRVSILARSKRKRIFPKHRRNKEKMMWFTRSSTPNKIEAKRTEIS